MNSHSQNCNYNDCDALLYCIMDVNGKRLPVSAREAQVFNLYLNLAKKKDKGLKIDMDAADGESLSLVYGGLLFQGEYGEIADLAVSLKGYAFLDLDREKNGLTASCYQDIVLFPELKKSGSFIPFAALMQTTHPFGNPDTSVTMFPLMGEGCVWEQMANRPFLLACRKKMDLPANAAVGNWKGYIDEEQMLEAYRVADLRTGHTEG